MLTDIFCDELPQFFSVNNILPQWSQILNAIHASFPELLPGEPKRAQ